MFGERKREREWEIEVEAERLTHCGSWFHWNVIDALTIQTTSEMKVRSNVYIVAVLDVHHQFNQLRVTSCLFCRCRCTRRCLNKFVCSFPFEAVWFFLPSFSNSVSRNSIILRKVSRLPPVQYGKLFFLNAVNQLWWQFPLNGNKKEKSISHVFECA